MEKPHTARSLKERRRFFGMVGAAIGGFLAWGTLFRDRSKGRSEEPRSNTLRTSVTINPLAVPRTTRPTHNNG